MKSPLSVCLVAAAVAYAANPIGSKGYYNITTTGFVLELDTANQVASRLIANPGQNAGGSPFNFLLPVANRSDNGYYVSEVEISMCLYLC